jgi:hypothetical protein
MDVCFLDASRRPLFTSYGGDEALIPECDDEGDGHDEGVESLTEALLRMRDEGNRKDGQGDGEARHTEPIPNDDLGLEDPNMQTKAGKAILEALRKVRFRDEFAPEYRALIGASKTLARPIRIPDPDDPGFVTEPLPDGGMIIDRAPPPQSRSR